MTGRASGIRHAVQYARSARRALDAGKVAAALYDWGHARAHLGFIVGLTENPNLSLASVLLRKALLNMGTRIERAIEPRPVVPGYDLIDPIAGAFRGLGMTDTDLTNRAALAATAIARTWEVRER